MPGASNKAVGVAPILGFGPDDVVDAIIGLFDRPAKAPSRGQQEIEAQFIETVLKFAKPPNSARGTKTLQFVLIGGKILKLLFADDEGGSNSALIPVDEFFANDPSPSREAYQELIQRLTGQLTAAGFVVMEPVWLTDPKV